MNKSEQYTGKTKWKYKLDESNSHIPNKTEAKMIRRLMAETGKIKAEILKIKKYRQMIAEAQHKPQKRTGKRKRPLDYFFKRARKNTGLPNEHPLTKLEAKKIIKNFPFMYSRFDVFDKSVKQINFTKKEIEWFTENKVDYQTF